MQSTQRIHISKPPSASPMALLYKKPLRTEPASYSPMNQDYVPHQNYSFKNNIKESESNQKYYVGSNPHLQQIQQVQNKSQGIFKLPDDIINGINRHNEKPQTLITPGGSILDEGSLLVQKMPPNKFIKASGQLVRPIFSSPDQFQIKNKDTGQIIDVRTMANIKYNASNQQTMNAQFLTFCQSNLTEKIAEFIKNKRDSHLQINMRDSNGNSPLHIAVNNGNLHLVSLLLYHEAMIDAINGLHLTPLMMSCERGHEEIVQRLLTAGADINTQDINGNTSLHLSIINSQKKIIQILLKKQSIKYNAKNKDNQTPLDVCKSQEMKKYLEQCYQNQQIGRQNQSQIKIHEVSQENKSSIKSDLTAPTLHEDKIGSESFIVHGLIGKGNFGEVYLVEKRFSGKVFAMKVLHKSKIIQQNLTKYAVTERNVLSITKHPFIVRMRYAFQTVDKLFLILDYCPGGDLGEHLQREKRFPEERVKLYLTQIILALEDLHKRDIIFRDLKPDNIVLDADGYAMLTDFGLSKEGVLEHHTGARSFCGSIAYLAPEMLKRCGHGKAVDWYLLGVVMYELLAGIPPYYANNREELFNNIEKAPLRIPSYISQDASNLLKSLLQRNPAKRLGSGKGDAEEIKQHKYFTDINWDAIYDKKIQMQKPTRKIKLSRLQDYNVFEQSSFVEPERQHLAGWSFVEQK